jgi:polar amino acid transport system substrate-binding protein
MEDSTMCNLKKILLAAGIAISVTTSALAGPLFDRIKAGESIRLGFAAEPPFAYPGDKNQPLGFANAIAIQALKEMGHDNIEPVVTDWGGMIPGLNAGRLDIVTGGMYILKERCANVDFSAPIGRFGDGLIVPKGNPKGLKNYADIKAGGAVMVTGAGYNTISAAKSEGIAEGNIMQVPGPTEILAAVRAGRADAGVLPFLEAHRLATHESDTIEATDPTAMPDWTFNWIGLGFRKDDDDFRQAFDAALAKVIGTPEMLAAVEKFEYVRENLPGDTKTDWVCANR